MRKLFRFPGGVHLDGHKSISSESAIRPLPLPDNIILPMRQHIGAPAEPLVEVGERVLKGQLIAESQQYVSAPVHASTSGKVVAIDRFAMPHPSHIAEPAIVIAPDGEDRWCELDTELRPDTLSPQRMRERIAVAGVVGLGGAVFPSSVKLKPTRKISTLLINGAECEPFITCDDAVMREHADAILRGCLLLIRLLDADECIIAVEDNKPQAIESLRSSLLKLLKAGLENARRIDIVNVPTLFPAGGEKQLIKVTTGKEVPSGGLPYQAGIVCVNVATCAAVHDAVYLGRPLIDRVVTVTGPNVSRPGNYRVLLGTPMQHVLDMAGVSDLRDRELIMGGPMMGQRLQRTDVPVVKASNCLLVNETRQANLPVMPCIRCGACARACPMQLLPQQLYWHSRAANLDKLAHYHIKDCIECGCCAVVCPSQIPLVHHFRFGKSAIADRNRNRDMANQSRVRNENRQRRLQRIEAEKEAKRAARKAARKNRPAGNNTSDANDVQQPAAEQRAKAS